MPRRKIAQAVEKRLSVKQNRQFDQPAVIGDKSGVVDVAGRPGYVWIQVQDSVTMAWCAPGMSRTPGMSVVVGYRPEMPDLLQVLGMSNVGAILYQGSNGTGGTTIGKHRSQHEWPNSDAVMVDERQITPLRITPLGGFSVNVLPGFVWIGDVLYYVSLTNPFVLDLLVPTTADKVRFVWIVIDNTGTLQTVTGAEVDTAAFDTSVVPTFASTVEYVLGAVRLFTGQTAVWEGLDGSDVLDLRFPIWHKGGSSSGHVIQDEGTPLTARPALNFIGAGVTATDNAGTGATDVTIPGGGHTIQASGSSMPTQPNLNFVGATVTNDAGNSATVVTITAPTITSASNDLTWFVDGTIAALASHPQAFVMPRDSTIEKVIAVIAGTGGSGSTIIDINLGGTTIFTTQANRPTIAAGGASSSIKIPDVVTLHSGDVITLDIDSAGVGASGLTVVVAMTVPVSGGGGSAASIPINLLIVGGGGGGGKYYGGGGGGGGVLELSTSVASGAVCGAVVGSGGAGASSFVPGANGGNSSFKDIVVSGGGGGGGSNGGGSNGISGGSGGGAGGTDSASGGNGVSGFGYSGGSKTGAGGVGGGGAGSAASSGAGSNGGNGVASSVSGSSVYYGGGGGGSYSSYGEGGNGGGGRGATDETGAVDGTANTGGGGGGGSSPQRSGNGGSGVVVVCYADTIAAATTIGNVACTNVGGYRVYVFTGYGLIMFPTIASGGSGV